MNTERHLELLRAEGDRLAAMPVEALAAPVPAVDGWTLEHVVRHVAKVHQWVTALLASPSDVDVGAVAEGLAGAPKGPACLEVYRETLDSLVVAFAGRDPADPVSSFIGTADVAFWARRQALEVAVHRMDAADAVAAAAGPTPDPLAVDGAADGIDEWANVFLAMRWSQRFGELPADLVGRTVHVHGTDDPPPPDGAEWILRLEATGASVDPVHAKGDVALRGPVEALLLTLWRRRPLGDLDVVGDVTVAERLLDVARF